MKILIIGFAKLKYMPYLNLYLENINKENNQVEILYWNRDLRDEDLSFVKDYRLYEFKCYQEDDVTKLKKIKSFLKFRCYAKEILKNNYDFVVVIQSVPAVLLADILTKKYKGKYIYDYRDITYENIFLYKKVVYSLVANAAKVFISSDCFRKELPEDKKILTVHNVLQRDLQLKGETFVKKENTPITIGFWGYIRSESINLEIIKKVSKDKRFILKYFGREQAVAHNLKKYVNQNNIGNVFFCGEYEPRQKNDIVRSVDIVHNINDDANAIHSVSNKFYDGIIFKRPQLCMDNTFMSALSEDAETGKAVNPYCEDFTQQIYDYYISLDEKVFVNNCDKQLENVTEQCEMIKKNLSDLFCGESMGPSA